LRDFITNVDASFKNSVLTVALPKSAPAQTEWLRFFH